MNRFKTSGTAALFVVVAAIVFIPRALVAAEITIGTGSPSGVYYQVGKAICRLVNAGTQEHGVRCRSIATPGSIANLKDIRDGDLQLAVAQSDWQFHASRGSGPFSDAGTDEDLRALFSVHGEPFTVVARRDSGILTFDDLKGMRVNIGNPGSGQRATMETVMAAKGWDKSVFALANELPASQQSLALCHDRVQAMVYTVGHPNASVAQAAGLCDARIVEVSGPEIDKLVAENPYYAYTEVPGGIYPGNPEPVVTFGVKATVVSSAKVDEATIYAVVKAVFDNLSDMKKMHPAFGTLQPEAMVSDGLSAPLHDGASKYFSEKGLK
ncbi:MAG: TAXI family TRAP transporter solute-binding subunit [Gammaproteobacteria bacterium]|nr:TAXI family TRAP transporter solute-binding subunit [Gammaproteobacteria bacterium]